MSGRVADPRRKTLSEDASEAAAEAALISGVEIRLLDRVEQFNDVVDLFGAIWASGEKQAPINVETLRAVSKAGSYVAGAFEENTLVGACIGFFAAPDAHALHSHIAGVNPRMRSRSVGFALKVHQRAWALSQGIREISWTFDPLISRNAHFNLVKLGAKSHSYLRNYYGQMSDVINGDDDTDRLLVTWDLHSEQVASACRGKAVKPIAATQPLEQVATILSPRANGAPHAQTSSARWQTVRLPRDIEALRREDPQLASGWRLAVRTALGDSMDAGARVLGFDAEHGYVIEAHAAR